MGNPYRNHKLLRIDEVSDYVGRTVSRDELPSPAQGYHLWLWWKQDIDDWLDSQRGPGGDQRQEAS